MMPRLFCLIALVSFSVCKGQQQAALKDPDHPAWRQQAPASFKVKITTSKGPFVLEVYRTWAPLGADRFYNLVRNGFFDDSRFYRIRAGVFAQFGIPGNPEIAKVWQRNSFKDDPAVEKNVRGTIAYAMTGPDARTTQLYINLKDNPQQDEQGFVPIGRVIHGVEVVDQLYSEYAEASGGGMRGGKQGKLFEEGNAYLDREFPRLDKLIKAEIIKEP